MRIGEATALQWWDIDFKNNHIVVRRNIPHHRQVETTKTESSQRKVDMSPELTAELKPLLIERKKQALSNGEAFNPKEWVFSTSQGTPIHYTTFMGKPYARRRRGSCLRIGPARPLESVYHFEDLFALGTGNAAFCGCGSGQCIGKCSANVGEKRRGQRGGEDAKSLILLVELRGIEPLTS
jgi:hypothetical protein